MGKEILTEEERKARKAANRAQWELVGTIQGHIREKGYLYFVSQTETGISIYRTKMRVWGRRTAQA